MRNLILTIQHDDSPEKPGAEGGWKVIPFIRNHIDREDFNKHWPPNIGLRRKLDVGLAFVLDYFEHGNCVWSISGTGPQCQWDNSRGAGLLIWTGKPGDIRAKTREDRAKDAARFLEVYTDWCNGDVNEYHIEDEDGEDVSDGWHGPWYGTDEMCEEIPTHFKSGDNIKIEGDGDWLKDYIDLPEGANWCSVFEDLDAKCPPEYVI